MTGRCLFTRVKEWQVMKTGLIPLHLFKNFQGTTGIQNKVCGRAFLWSNTNRLLFCKPQRYILITTVKADVKSIRCFISLIDMYKYLLYSKVKLSFLSLNVRIDAGHSNPVRAAENRVALHVTPPPENIHPMLEKLFSGLLRNFFHHPVGTKGYNGQNFITNNWVSHSSIYTTVLACLNLWSSSITIEFLGDVSF